MINLLYKRKVLIAQLFIIIGYGISIPGLWMMRENPSAFQLSWIFTTVTLAVLLFFHKPFNIKFFLALLAVGVVGWAVEAIGTNTALVFGNYSYGQSLGPKIWRTPFAMLINWMISVYLVTMILRAKIVNIWRLGFAGALIMVIYDILLEPVAIRLDMWSWAGGNPPLQNYIAWFVVSFPLVMLLGKYTKGSENPLVPIVLICQLLFFGLLNVLIAFAGM
ncbi:MAG TPA: carotenoid biosynthesis protein [Tenuifilaceae bacterium]|nr:carotenoid biosynthesis protein [Tenuifilaceae bacterium]